MSELTNYREIRINVGSFLGHLVKDGHYEIPEFGSFRIDGYGDDVEFHVHEDLVRAVGEAKVDYRERMADAEKKLSIGDKVVYVDGDKSWVAEVIEIVVYPEVGIRVRHADGGESEWAGTAPFYKIGDHISGDSDKNP